jgi:hypothetical protein
MSSMVPLTAATDYRWMLIKFCDVFVRRSCFGAEGFIKDASLDVNGGLINQLMIGSYSFHCSLKAKIHRISEMFIKSLVYSA